MMCTVSQGLSEHGVRVEPSGDILERTNLLGSSAIKHVHGDLNSFSLGVIPGMKLLLTQSHHESPSIASANIYGMNLARTENYMYGAIVQTIEDLNCTFTSLRACKHVHPQECQVLCLQPTLGAIPTFQANQAVQVVSAVNPTVYELNS